MTQSKRPLLVTGAHRTGTTWVGRMLAADGRTAYISEPLNVLHRRGVFDASVSHWYTYITEKNEAEYLPAFTRLLDFRYRFGVEINSLRSRRDFLRMARDLTTFLKGRMFHQRALLKDPFAVFSAAWFAKRLDFQVIVTVRHPAGFASSLQRLNWPFDFRDLMEQPALMQDWLAEDSAEMAAMPSGDLIGQAGLLWRMVYRVVHALCGQTPDIKVVRHEDLARDPENAYRELFAGLGLDFNTRAQRAILNSSSADNPSELAIKKVHSVKLDSRASRESWKNRLRVEDIARLRMMTESVSYLYYSDSEW